MAHDHIELVAVDDEQPPSVGRRVDIGGAHLDAAEMRAEVVAQEFVVVAGQVDDAGALARLSQQLLRDVVMRLRPMPVPAEPPAVDDVADQVDRLGVVVAEKIEEEVRLAATRTQMHIGNEQGAHVARRERCGHQIPCLGP